MKTNKARILCLLLSVCLLLGLVPIQFAAAADTPGNVIYNRKAPEVAVLNDNTGKSSTFYQALKKNYGKSGCEYTAYYNGVSLFYGGDYAAVDYKTRVTDDKTGVSDGRLYFGGSENGYGGSVLRTLSQKRDNLAANLSATLYNRVHPHKVSTFKSQDVLAYESVFLCVSGDYKSRLYGSLAGMNNRMPRMNDYSDLEDDPYKTIYYTEASHGQRAFISFEKSSVTYASGTCTCGGAYAENMLVTFRDSSAPTLSDIRYSTDGGTTWVRNHSTLYLGKGDTLLIKLTYDEPIRFADDSARHDDLYLMLNADGAAGTSPKAYLTELSDDSLYFRYEMTGSEGKLNINSVSLSSMFGSKLPLKQVIGDKSFTLSESDMGNVLGFSETTAYITDIAGNPIHQKSYLTSLVFDTEAPYIASVLFEGDTANADVKEALGDKTDLSDTHLGEGDSMRITVKMNEELTFTKDNIRRGEYATIVTNIVLTDGKVNNMLGDRALAGLGVKTIDGKDFLTVSSLYLYSYDGQTQIYGSTIPIHSNMKTENVLGYENGDGQIYVIAVDFTDSEEFMDLAGNRYDGKIAATANAGAYILDVDAPAVSCGGTIKEGSGFRMGITIEDKGSTASGIQGLHGAFSLQNGGDGQMYEYEYVMNALPETPQSGWVSVKFGEEISFTQVASGNYLHVRPKSGVSYGDVSACTVKVSAKDLAGNRTEKEFVVDDESNQWILDGIAPTAYIQNVSRSLSASEGTLSVTVHLADRGGLKEASYSTDGKKTFTPLAFSYGVAEADTTAVIGVASGENFEEEFFVRVSDIWGNEADISLGTVSYDLSEAAYTLRYPTDYADKATVNLLDLAADDEIILMLEIPEEIIGKPNRYAVYAITSDDAIDAEQNLLTRYMQNGNGWYLMSAVRSVNTDGSIRYDFDADEDYRDMVDADTGYYKPVSITESSNPKELLSFWESFRTGSFAGNLSFTVVSGKRNAFTRWQNASGVSYETYGAPLSGGNGSYSISESRFSLRINGYPADLPYTPTFTAENDKRLSVSYTSPYYMTDDAPQLSTLANEKFIISIPEDKFGWHYEPIDYRSSYVLLKNRSVSSGGEYTIPIEPIVSSSGNAVQTVTVPSWDFESGIYDVTLYLNCRVGPSYIAPLKKADGTLYDGIVVDATEPNDDFYMDSMTFEVKDSGSLYLYDGLDLYGYEKRDIMAENGVYYLPLYRNLAERYNDGKHSFSFKTDEEKATKLSDRYSDYYVGQYSLKVWNTDPSLSAFSTEECSGADGEAIQFNANPYMNRISVISSASEATSDGYLYLYKGTANTVAVQKVYANGKTSKTKYYTFFPDDRFITGTAKTSPENGGQLIFTPDANADTENAILYAYLYTCGKTQNDTGTYPQKTVNLEPYPDGTWRCSLSEDGAHYTVVGINKHGSVSLTQAGYFHVNAPWFDESGLTVTDEGGGVYSISFTLLDDRGDIQNAPPEITVSFDESYASLLGTDTFRFTPEWDIFDSYSWKADTESQTGIFEITATHGERSHLSNMDFEYDTLTVKIKAVCTANGTDAAQPITATVSAKDIYGMSSQMTASQTVRSVSSLSPVFSYVPGSLTARFSQPIRPIASWAWQGEDKTDYLSSEWRNAFPIPGNGTYTIEYTDIFGNIHSESVTLTDTFIVNGTDYSIDLYFSTTEQTGGSVVITASSHDGGQLIFWEREDDPSGKESYTTVAPIGGYPTVSTETRSARFHANNKILITRYNNQYNSNYQGPWQGISTAVYITNIAAGTPNATVMYYLESAGSEFTYEQLEDYVARFGQNGTLNSDGTVTARYYTDRNVTPTQNSGIEFVFRKGSERSHLFTFTDDFGNDGSVTASLPSGLNLTDPPAKWVDIYAPIVTANIYTKRFGAYSAAESFLAGENETVVRDRFASAGTAQGFLLKLDIRDDSPYTISLSETDGAVLSGNAITVTSPCDFTVTVTDSENNSTVFSVRSDMLGSIDTISPAAQTEVVSSGLYEKDGYVRLYDVDENGNELTGKGHDITLTQPQNVTKVTREDGKEWYKLSFTENGSVGFVFHDEAGNYGNASLEVDGIDVSHPVLTLRWSPSYTYEQDGVLYYDDAYPTQNKTAGNITAHVSSDVPLKEVRLQSDGFAPTVLPLDGSTEILGSDGSISARYGTERITISYEKDYEHKITLTAVGPNGRESDIVLSEIVGRIDRTAPVITETKTPIVQNGSSAPIGYTVTLAPDEDAYSQNYGEYTSAGTPVYYNSASPLVLTVTRDGDFTVYFSDRAGNVTAHTVSVTGIDRTAPELSIRYPDDNPNLLRPTNEAVSVYVKANEDCALTVGDKTVTLTKDVEKELSFTENGTFILKACDKAGNERSYIITVHCIDKGLPSLRFDTNFVYLIEGSSQEELTALLDKGYTARDNVEMPGYPVVRYDTADVDLSAAGSYTVPYTATDEAGNTFEAVRFVNVVGKNTLCLYVNGKLILPEGTAVIAVGENNLTVQNLQNILPGEYEPHTVKICKGLLSLGQMKHYSGSSVKVSANGDFSVDSAGFYTVLVTTQSKRTVRITLYAEK